MAPNGKKALAHVTGVSLRSLQNLSDAPAKPNDSWEVFWDKMQQAGWWKRELFYANGINYFTSEDEVKQFAIDHLGWEGHDNEKKRERDDIIASKRLSFETLEKIYRERKRQRTTIDLTQDNAGPVEPDETDNALRNMAKQAEKYSTKLTAVKKEVEDTKEDLEDANELVQQQTLTVDVWQSRFDELSKLALEQGLDVQKINEIRNRPLSSGR